MGVANAYVYASRHPERYREFLAKDGSLIGPGLTADQAAPLPPDVRLPGVVVTG